MLDVIYDLADERLETSSGEVAKRLGVKPPKIASYAARLERRAAIARGRGVWRVTNRLLHRYRTTGDIIE